MNHSLASLPPLAETLKAHGIFARKRFGQHFLLDQNITDRVAAEAGALEGVNVIEVGPGPGGLTRSLLRGKPRTLTAIEMDQDFLPLLAELAQAAGEGMLTVMRADALKVNVADAVPAPRKIVANLPYNVATPLLFQWLELLATDARAIQSMTLMFQKEVAERIAARPSQNAYGRLAVMSQFLCEVRYGFDLPPGAFHPAPKVWSAVVTLVPHASREDVPYKQMEKVVAAAFGQRRKMLRGALKTLGLDSTALCAKAGIDPERRAETLSVQEFCALTRAYGEMTA